MNEKDKQLTIVRYRERLNQYGPTLQALASGNAERQSLRFNTLIREWDLNGASILDLGCGFGDFYGHLLKLGIKVQYTGYDICPEVIQVAASRYPDVHLEVRDIQEDGIPQEFDYVVSSQMLNYKLQYEDNFELAKDMIRRCFAISKKGMVFDFLSSYVNYREDHLYYYSPEEMFRYCKTLTKRVTLRHDYPLFEFAVYIYPDFQGWHAKS